MLQLTTNESDWLGEKSLTEMTVDELAREGARRILVEALAFEVAEYIEALKHERNENGHALVVRNGYGRPRKITVGSGTIEIAAPRVNDRRQGKKFTSSILPPYMRRSPDVNEVLPILYLKGLSSGDFSDALKCLLGEAASGLSAASVTRLKKIWADEYLEFKKRDLKDKDYVYIWADGVHLSVRLEDERLCLLVIIGVTIDGKKEVVAVEDGYRESKESWASLLRDLSRRGMNPPVLATGDGALGFWAATRDVWPETKEERCWVHKIANVLDKLPKKLQPKAKELLHEMMYAPDKKYCLEQMELFKKEYNAKYPKAVECLLKDKEALTTHFSFPAEHWIHIRSTNPIESTFSTVKLRTRVTKGAGSRSAGLAMAFKLLEGAQGRWRRVNAPHLVAKVREGIVFKDGVEVVRSEGRVA